MIGAIGMFGAVAMATPAAASDATTYATWAEGEFLSGSLAGLDLDTIAGLTPASALNDGTQSTQETIDPLAVRLLGTQVLNIGSVRVTPDDILQTQTSGGVLSQYARAEINGVALGASGTVGDGGAIGPNASNPSNALTLSLDHLIGNSYNAVISDLELAIRAIAANAEGTLTTVDGDYYIDGLTLSFTSPALAGISSTVTKAVAAADAELDVLSGSNGELAAALNAALVAANPALSLGGGATVSIALSHNLQAVVAELLTKTWGGSGVTFNVTTGKVTVDLNALIGGDLNNRPVNSEILTGATVNKIVSTISQNVTTLTDQVIDRLNAALGNVKLDVDVDLNVLTDQAPLIGEVCQYEDSNGNILGEVLGKLLGTLVCTPTTTLLPKLQTSVAVDVHGTVTQVLNGQAPATVTAKVLGIPVSISTGRVLTALSNVLGNRLYDTGGIMPTLRGLLDGPLLSQANSGLLGSTSIQAVLSNILSIKVNLQESNQSGAVKVVAPNSVFTQTAMRVSVAATAGSGGLTTLNLAAASVAPTVTADNVGDPGGPGDPGDPTGDPGDPSTPGLTPTSTDPASTGGLLAYTGTAIGAALAILLGLLISGAWLVRQGYLRNHPTLES